MNNRFEIKAQAYMKAVRQWALAKGEPFFTWKQQRKALAKYEAFVAPIKN